MREPTNHTTDSYFCMTDITGFSYKIRSCVKYPDVPSVSKPVPHDPITCPVPTLPDEYALDEEKQEGSDLLMITQALTMNQGKGFI